MKKNMHFNLDYQILQYVIAIRDFTWSSKYWTLNSKICVFVKKLWIIATEYWKLLNTSM